jgi:hypothetical protein
VSHGYEEVEEEEDVEVNVASASLYWGLRRLRASRASGRILKTAAALFQGLNSAPSYAHLGPIVEALLRDHNCTPLF